MKINDELNIIKNKDLSTMTEKELKEYKAYLEDLNKNAEAKSKSKIWKNISNFGGLGMSICIAGAMFYAIYALYTALAVIPLYIACGVAFCLTTCIYILRGKYKATQKTCQEIKQVCNSKIIEVEKYIAILDIRKDHDDAKETTNTENNSTAQ